MITDAKELQKMVDFAKIAKAQGFTPEQVDKALSDRGSSLQEVGTIMQFGPEKIAQIRQAKQEYVDSRPSNTLVDNLLTKDAALAGAKGLAVGAERVVNGATLGAYDWANDKLGLGSKERAAETLAMARDAGLGTPMRAAMLAAEIGGGAKSPIVSGIYKVGNIANGIAHPLAREVAQSALGGAAIGGVHSAFDSDFNAKDIATGATVGGVVGGAVPLVREGVKAAGKAIKAGITGVKKGIEKTPFIGSVGERSAEEMKMGAQEISGAMPDSGELTGTAVKNLSDDVTAGVKAKSKALYDKAEQLASGRPVVLDKNSNFSKTFEKLSQNATKTGRSELNKVWNEVGHNKFDAPNYETAKSFRSWLSEKSATGGTGLTKKQYGDLVAALDKDIEASLGSKAAAAKKAADAFYRNEMGNPDSITTSVNKMLRNDPVSVVGNRAVSSAQGKAWKASPLKKLIDEGEKISSPYVADVKQALQANTTTRAQFNRMSLPQKQMVYGDKLQAAEKNFNGGLWNTLEKYAHKATDVVLTPFERMMIALRPQDAVVGTATIYKDLPSRQ